LAGSAAIPSVASVDCAEVDPAKADFDLADVESVDPVVDPAPPVAPAASYYH